MTNLVKANRQKGGEPEGPGEEEETGPPTSGMIGLVEEGGEGDPEVPLVGVLSIRHEREGCHQGNHATQHHVNFWSEGFNQKLIRF